MIIDGDTTKSDQGDEGEDCEDSSELAREHPSRMTHGHWLRRYSGLHASEASGLGPGNTDQTARRTPLASPTGTTTATTATQAAGQQQQQQTGKRRPRLLTRWTTAMWASGPRSVPMGGSQSDVTAKSLHLLAAAPNERAGASSAPPSAATSTADWHHHHHRRRHRTRESQTTTTSREVGSRRSRAARSHNGAAAKLANGSMHNFGCQLCGWRSHAPSSSCSSCSSIAGSVSPAACRVDTTRARSSTGKLASWLMRSTPSPRPGPDAAQRVKLASPGATDRKLQQLPVLDVGCAHMRHEAAPQSLRQTSPYRQLARFLGATGKQGEQQQQQQVGAAGACTGARAGSTRSLVASLFASPRKRRSGGQMETGKPRDQAKKFATELGDEGADERPIHLTKSSDSSRDKMSRTAAAAAAANANEISKRIECTPAQERSKLTELREMTVASRQVNDNFKLANPCAGNITATTTTPTTPSGADQSDGQRDEEKEPNGLSLRGELLQAAGEVARNANELGASLQAFKTRQSGAREDQDDDDQAQFQLNQTSRVEHSKLVTTPTTNAINQWPTADPRSSDRSPPVASRLISLAATTAAAQRRHFESSTSGDGGTQPAASHFAPLIQPTLAASSSSSFASSSINLDSATAAAATVADYSQQRDWSSLVTSSADKSVAPAAPARPSPHPQVATCTASHDDNKMTTAPSVRPHSQPASAAKVVAHDENAAGTSGFGLRTNFKKLVKRQQSVDSYRMARDLKQKLKRQQQQQENGASDRNKQGHHSHETIKSDQGGQVATSGRKFSMRSPLAGGGGGDQLTRMPRPIRGPSLPPPPPPPAAVVEICVDPYARPGTFMLPGEQMTGATGNDQRDQPKSETEDEGRRATTTRPLKQVRVSPQPPKTLSLMPVSATVSVSGMSANGHSPSVSQSCVSPGASLLMGSGFSGCITPTYPTHHLPSPKYVSPAAFMAMQKKHSNASTISSSLGVDLGVGPLNGGDQNVGANSGGQTLTLAETQAAAAAAGFGKSDTESSFSLTPSSRVSKTIDEQQRQQDGDHKATPDSNGVPAAGATNGATAGGQTSDTTRASQAAEAETAAAAVAAAAAAQRRANLAEHIYDNKCGLGEDMKFLASLPELCDITFLVGETREPVCAVKSVLAARSRVFHKIFFGSRIKAAAAAAAAAAAHRRTEAASAAQANADDEQSQQQVAANRQDQSAIERRRDSSPRSAGRNSILVAGGPPSISPSLPKSSVPNSRSSSPNNQQQPQWSVTADTSGLSSTSPHRTTTGGPTVTRADSSVVGVIGNRNGRVSVTSNGRESVSQASQGSTQPLIIGPGQVATLAPVSKSGGKSKSKGRLRDQARAGVGGGDESQGGGGSGVGGGSGGHSRLSRMFLNKRASDPSIKHQHQQNNTNTNNNNSGPLSSQAGGGAHDGFGGSIDSGGQHPQGSRLTNGVNQSYLDKMSSSQRSTTMIIEEFEPDVFRQLIEYIHTGCVLLQARTLLGLLNAADYYGLEQLRRACLRFVSCCITVDTVCSLLSTAERYIQYKCTKSIVQKVLEFVDTHANEIFKLNAFGLLPEHVVRLILARDGLQADEHAKYNGVYTWCEHYCRSYELTNMSDVMHNFLNLIQFHKIPTAVLLTEIYPCHIVPDDIFLSALAYQAEPEVFEAPPSRQPRRMTLPNSIMLKTVEPLERHSQDCSISQSTGGGGESIGRRQSSNSPASNSQQSRQLLGSRKSTGGATNWTPTPSPPAAAAAAAPKQVAGRKGSIAQVSLSGVKRLSHKLSIKRRHHSNMPAATSSSESRRRRGSGGAFSLAGRSSELSKQPSLVASSTSGQQQQQQQPVVVGSRDPIEVGRQILDAYLQVKRQQELEEEERRQREEDELRAAEEAKRRAAGGGGGTSNAAAGRASDAAAQQNRSASSRKPLVKTPSSTRKSFRDFKHISRRIFMRHSSSKTIQVEQAQSQSPTNSGGGGKVNSSSHYRFGSREMSSDSGTSLQPKRFSSMDKSQEGVAEPQQQQQQQQQTKIRRLMKIKRSETVFEAATSLPGKLTYQRNKTNVRTD